MDVPVFEVAVYKVQKEKIREFLHHQQNVHAALKKFEGFKSLRSLRSIDSPDTFVDYCEWESHEDAVRANEKAMITPEFAVFFELGDGMIAFSHCTSTLFTEVQ